MERGYREGDRKRFLDGKRWWYCLCCGVCSLNIVDMARHANECTPIGEMKFDDAYIVARWEHAFLLRAEGLSWREVGRHLGVTGMQASTLAAKMGRFVSASLQQAKVTIDTDGRTTARKPRPLGVHQAWELKNIAASTLPFSSVHPQAAAELMRRGFIEQVNLPSEMRAHKGRLIVHFQVTAAGRDALKESE